MEATGIRAAAAEAAALLALIPYGNPRDRDPAPRRVRVLRDGRPVPIGEWKSKKSRDLLKSSCSVTGRP